MVIVKLLLIWIETTMLIRFFGRLIMDVRQSLSGHHTSLIGATIPFSPVHMTLSNAVRILLAVAIPPMHNWHEAIWTSQTHAPNVERQRRLRAQMKATTAHNSVLPEFGRLEFNWSDTVNKTVHSRPDTVKKNTVHKTRRMNADILIQLVRYWKQDYAFETRNQCVGT